jgi:hypothetical protein
MPTTITINQNAEHLLWPRQCVCCGGLDETDVETIVPETVQRDRDLADITSAHVPHCVDCAAHSARPFSVMKLVALVTVIALLNAYVWFTWSALAGKIFAFGGLCLVGIIVAVDRRAVRRLMRQTCSATGPSYQFLHPCSDDVTTITFANDHFARAFRAANLGGSYEP